MASDLITKERHSSHLATRGEVLFQFSDFGLVIDILDIDRSCVTVTALFLLLAGYKLLEEQLPSLSMLFFISSSFLVFSLTSSKV